MICSFHGSSVCGTTKKNCSRLYMFTMEGLTHRSLFRVSSDMSIISIETMSVSHSYCNSIEVWYVHR
jgi:hypothetical protein